MDSINLGEEEEIIRDLGPILEEGEEEEEEEEGVFKAKAMNEMDAGRDIHNEDVLKQKSLRPPL